MGISNVGKNEGPELSRLESFERTYFNLHQAVYANIFKIVRSAPIAEDLLQDVFLAFWENMERLEAERIPNWLFVVSFNKSLSHIKKMARTGMEGNPRYTDEPADVLEIDESEFEEKLTQVYQAIELLPERKREIFKQYRMEGKGAEQIAAEMQLSVHTVKDHLKIAHKQIRDHLAQNMVLKTGTGSALFLFLLTY